ncbi:MAG: hypothetical protein JNL64_04025 [Blastocatellia bacterium]|nr:hypothetical protein [Blastocatellia bacterium]
MLKTQATSTNGNGNGRLPKASDFKLPKRLTKLDRELIETSVAVSKSLREAYKNEQKSKG